MRQNVFEKVRLIWVPLLSNEEKKRKMLMVFSQGSHLVKNENIHLNRDIKDKNNSTVFGRDIYLVFVILSIFYSVHISLSACLFICLYLCPLPVFLSAFYPFVSLFICMLKLFQYLCAFSFSKSLMHVYKCKSLSVCL